ncbi:MAG: TRAP transporter small permease subunit [Pseudomonadota bacterium]
MDRIILALGRLASWGFAIIILMMVYEVVARYGFGAPTIWAHEIAGLLGAIAFLLAGAYCMVEDGHMRITAFVDGMRAGTQRLFRIVGYVCGAIYLGGLAFSAFQIANRAAFRFMDDGTWFPERSGTSWNTPLPAYVKVALFVGAALFLLVVLRALYRALRGQDDDPPVRLP